MISYILILSIPALAIAITIVLIKLSKKLLLYHKLLIAVCVLLVICIYVPAAYRISRLYYKLNTITVVDHNNIPASNALVLVKYMSTEFNIAGGSDRTFKVEVIETDSTGVANLSKTMREIPIMFFPIYCRMDNDPLVMVVKDNYRLTKKRAAQNDVNLNIKLSDKYNDFKVPDSFNYYINDYGSVFFESDLNQHINNKSYAIVKRHLLSNLLTVTHDESRGYSAYLERYNDGIKKLEQYDERIK